MRLASDSREESREALSPVDDRLRQRGRDGGNAPDAALKRRIRRHGALDLHKMKSPCRLHDEIDLQPVTVTEKVEILGPSAIASFALDTGDYTKNLCNTE